MKLDRALFAEDDFVEVDIDPFFETPDGDETNEMIERYGFEAVDLTHHFFHRHSLWKMHILSRMDLDTDDVVAFTVIEEENNLYSAEQRANAENQNQSKQS